MKLFTFLAVRGILVAYVLSVFPANASDADGDMVKALAATDKRNCPKALSFLESAQKKAGNDYQVYLEIAAIYVRCDKRQQSKQFYEKAISLAKRETAQNPYTKSDIAVAYRAIGSYANAVIYGKAAARLFVKAGDTYQVERMNMLISDLEGRKVVGQL